MNHLFVPYTQSLELNQLGFNEECFGLYPRLSKELVYKIMPNQKECDQYFGGILAPLYSQVFNWFREKHNLVSYIEPCSYVDIPTLFEYKIHSSDDLYIGTRSLYKEEQLKLLQKLIEIVKNNNL